ncbi:error-prone DNA polymerase [Sphingomonas sp. R1]|uniref:error-prone DNA polymerase n=1 Tax=Sphingomonas sp. R1 TaxID=399176 RepID=UPI002224137E|nr:error-prone DNA polymerase [Sphingomonas sp. R1]UYY76173.1 error-prone DNA polymerase [Sphingomonas sp. R1]
MYSELQVTSHYSFLRGASAPSELFEAAAAYGMPALGITDHNSVGGIVRGLVAAEETGVRLVTGCRLDLTDGSGVLVWPEDLAAWSRLTRLLSIGKARADAQHGEKGQCFLHWEDVAGHADGLVAALVPGMADSGDPAALRWMADVFGNRGHVTLTRHRRPQEAVRLHGLAQAAAAHGLTPLATGDVLYHHPDRRMLHDVMTAIRHTTTVDDLGFRRARSADRHLKPPHEMARRFAAWPDALQAVEAVVERCSFNPRELGTLYRYPDEVVMSGRSPQEALAKLARDALAAKFPEGPPPAYAELLEKELRLVEKFGYAPYFLTVHSIVRFARAQEILCQGRGSAANSLICFLLGVTSIDPVVHKLLFERFISEDRDEPPDIDVDFEHERREEVIQWIYETYGARHAALTAVVSRYRTRGAVREVGKALGLPEDVTAGLAGQVWGWSNEGVSEADAAALNLDASEPRLALTLDLARQLIGTPRHRSQHPGGFVLAQANLDEIVPIEPAAMVDRRVIEWEKDDIETLGLMKVDILGLGMLGCMRRAFDLLEQHKGVKLTLASDKMQEDDPATFAMIRKADTLGTFQIESRAQMSMLPRLRPREFYDLVIQVAIVRPGPIQGDMVHPYLRRREGKEVVEYPSEELKDVLEKTFGVPLFQEQAMKVAIVGAGFKPAEADALRRAMATFKSTGGVTHFKEKMISGMLEKGYTQDFAERTFKQIEGFGSYGFPESHAASFAKIAYASSWMKCHHPDIFCAALLNAQPMGFYAPAQIVRDAREHGVEVHAVCVNDSGWDTRVLGALRSSPERGGEPWAPAHGGGAAAARGGDPGRRGTTAPSARPLHPSPAASGPPPRSGEELLPLRLGMRVVQGLSARDADAILAARAERPFTSIEDVWRRARVSPAALEKLARADGFRAFGQDRRQALWAIKALDQAPLPLFAGIEGPIQAAEPAVTLTPLTAGREVVEDYRATQLSLRAHPLHFLRGTLAARRIRPCGDLKALKDGARVEVAGIVLVRQKPGSAKSIFLTLEDETGIANAIVWPARFALYRPIILAAPMISVRGRLQREGEVLHLIAETITDLTDLLRSVGAIDLPRMTMPGDGATHGGTIDSRDRKVTRATDPAHAYPKQRTPESWPSRREDIIPIKSHDFH